MHLTEQWAFREGSAPEKTFRFGQDFMIDLDRPAGRKGNRGDECVISNRFRLQKETELGFGAGADYWFEAKLNGEIICTTFPAGNVFPEISHRNYQFRGVGKAGENLLEIRVRRGVKSWRFHFREEDPAKIDPCTVWKYSLAPEAPAKTEPCAPLTVEADPAAVLGRIKPMNAVNNGPIKARSTQSRGNFDAFRALEIPYVRNHDASFCSAYGGEHTVDIHAVFPDFSKDPTDPASYDFASTDRYLKTIMESGGKVFYRLGSKIEHAPEKYGTKVPPDFRKWAVVCEHIIRHFNEGWAGGFHMNIEYWEIWNEPDLPNEGNGSPTWQGTPEEFFELYRVTALHLKKCFPKLKIGGPALAGLLPWMEKFLFAMKAAPRVPLDFFSWHFYGSDPRRAARKGEVIRKLLDENGYRETESILDEWNYVRDWSANFTYSIHQIIGLKGAAFGAAMMIRCQDAPLDMLMYYDARPTVFNGLFGYYDYAPLKTYHVFAAWAKLARLGTQIKVDVKGRRGISATGATDGKGRIGIMIARFFEEDDLPGEVPLTLKVKGVDLRGAKLYLLDEKHDLADVPCRMTAEGEIRFSMAANTVLYLEK